MCRAKVNRTVVKASGIPDFEFHRPVRVLLLPLLLAALLQADNAVCAVCERTAAPVHAHQAVHSAVCSERLWPSGSQGALLPVHSSGNSKLYWSEHAGCCVSFACLQLRSLSVLKVIIFTANDLKRDIESKTQGVFWQDFPPKAGSHAFLMSTFSTTLTTLWCHQCLPFACCRRRPPQMSCSRHSSTKRNTTS